MAPTKTEPRMTDPASPDLLDPALWHRQGHGPRYEQLYRHLSGAIATGQLAPETQLPPERDLAARAQVSRVTVRKAVAQLVADGVLEQRRGAGSFVRRPAEKVRHSLSLLMSFTEYMRQRGREPTSRVLRSGIFAPSPDEQLGLALTASARVARLDRLRSAEGLAMALELSSLPADLLPDPAAVTGSLYAVLRDRDAAPCRAVQRISAVNLAPGEAALFSLPPGTAVLRIERTAYLPSGRPVEFTRGLYRPDLYDFIAEMRVDEG